MSKADVEVLFGPAGWSYPDWRGRIYQGREGLELISTVFDMVEVNSTFYHAPAPAVAESWLRKVAQNPTFRFTVKLWRKFTHELGFGSGDVRRFRTGIEPLVGGARLGTLLIQFPWSFRYERRSREHLARVLGEFEEFPLTLEVRHSSWNRPELLVALEAKNVTFCNIDQPIFDDSIEATSHVTADIGYVRLHGRNRAAWFRQDATRDQRYDYLYDHEELRPWAQRVRDIAQRCRTVFVVTNNHFGGSAIVNGLELANLYDGRRPVVPSCWIQSFPRLSATCRARVSRQLELFAPSAGA